MDEMITQFAVNSAGSLLRLAGDAIMAYLGWPGLIALAAGSLLAVSLSAKAMRFISTPKGMGVTAVVLVASLLAMGWLWPKLASADRPVKELASDEPGARRASGPQPPVKHIEAATLAAAEPSPILAERQTEPARTPGWLSLPLGYPVIDGVFSGLPLPPPVVAVPEAPALVAVHPRSGHLTPFRSHSPAANHSGYSGLMARQRMARPQAIGSIFGTPGFARANAPFTIHQWNNQLMHNPAAVHSMMGLGHPGIGGMAHPAFGGFGHSGHMGHIGGHH